MVIVWKLDRFSRDRYDSAHYKAILKKNGVKVVSAKENISEGPERIILESMLEGMAEYYSAELSVKIIRGMTENALKCKYHGGSLPLGYTTDSEQHYQVDPITAPVVQEIFRRYADGETVTKIINSLNQRGIKTSRGNAFNKNSLHCMLKNRHFIGEYCYRDIVIPGGVPAILSPELFEQVQRRLEQNKKAPARKKAVVEYLLTTKLFCGDCGAFMVGESGTGCMGARHYHYKCSNAKRNKGCRKKAVKKDRIEQLVVEQTKAVVLQDEAIKRIAKAVVALQKQGNNVLPLLEKQLKQTEKGH